MVSAVLTAVGALVAAGDRGVMATAIDGPESGSPLILEVDGASWFLEPVTPAPKLVVLGAIAAADALVPMAAAAGFAVHVIDTREWLAEVTRFPGATSVHCGNPLDMLRTVGVDSATSVVSFLHEARLEDPVLVEALQGPACYVGSMGSGKNSAAKRERLAAAGVESDLVARLRAPIGLRIGSRSPQEMAVAVLAEVVAAGRG